MDRVTAWLDERQSAGTLRELKRVKRLGGGRIELLDEKNVPGFGLWDFSSNDYLGLSEHPDVIAASRAALETSGAGAGAARLMSGDLDLNHLVEEEVARLKGKEAALLFGSGYMANTGIIPALVGRGDDIFCDRFNHASIYDGCRISGAKIHRFHHNDMGHLEELLKKRRGKGNALVVVESVYSMDGDRCPLTHLVKLAKEYSCLVMVDEAHATGLFGASGGGVIEEDGVGRDVDIAMGTFGKALGSYGAYAAASRKMISYLVNRARSFIYSTALPPAVLGASLASLALIREKPSMRHELFSRVKVFKEALRENGVLADLGPTQIVPVVIGESARAAAVAKELRKEGFYATAVRPPTVPKGTSRLRFSVTLHLSESVLGEAAAALGRISRV